MGFSVSCQRADFFREDITFRLDSTSFDVDGYYWFANNSAETVTSDIYYPFPNNSGKLIDSIRLLNISTGQNSDYKLEGRYGISFDLNIAPSDTVLFQIGYRQQIIGDSAIYILKSTQGWGKSISMVEYKLIISNSFVIKKFSYPPDKSYQVGNYTVFYWKKVNFMPKKDFVIKF